MRIDNKLTPKFQKRNRSDDNHRRDEGIPLSYWDLPEKNVLSLSFQCWIGNINMFFHICFSTVHLNFDIIWWTMTIIGHCDGQASRIFTISPVYPEFVTSTVRWEREKGVVSLSRWTPGPKFRKHIFFVQASHAWRIFPETEGGRCYFMASQPTIFPLLP